MRSDRNNASEAEQRFTIKERAGRRKGRMLPFSASSRQVTNFLQKMKTYISSMLVDKRRKSCTNVFLCSTRYRGARVKCKKELFENIVKKKNRNLVIFTSRHRASWNSYDTINLLFVKMRLVRRMSTHVISSRVIVIVVVLLFARADGKNSQLL